MKSVPAVLLGIIAACFCSQSLAQAELRPAEATRNYVGYGYGIRPPAGEKWHVSPLLDGHKAEFYLMPSRREAKRMHTVVAAVSSFWLMGCDTAAACLRAAVDALREVEPGARYTMVSLEEMPAPAPQPGCIRIRGMQHDRGDAEDKGRLYEIHSDGMLCSHPEAANLILNPNFSERLREGDRRHEIAGEVIDDFLRGFEYRPVGPAVDSYYEFRENLGGLAWDGEHLWVQHRSKLSMMDAETNRPIRTFDSPDGAIAFMVVDRSLWLAEYNNKKLARLDVETGSIIASVPLPGTPMDMAFAADSLWITHGDSGDIVRVDTRDNAVTRVLSSGAENAGIVAAFDAIWVSNTESDSVIRIDPADNSVVAKIPVCEGPLDLAVLGGYVWAGCARSGVIAKIDPASNMTAVQLRVLGSPFYMDAGEKALWITNKAEGTVSRFDINSGKTTAIMSVGARPANLLAAQGAVWVTELSSGSLFRIIDSD